MHAKVSDTDAPTMTPESARAKPTAPVWEDLALLDQHLDEDERLIRDTARDYCQDKLMARVVNANRHEQFDREIMNEFGERGLLGMTLPEDYDCASTNFVSYGLEGP